MKEDRLRLAERKELRAATFEETFPGQGTTVVPPPKKSPFIFRERERGKGPFFLFVLSSFDGSGVTFPRNPSHNKAKHRIERDKINFPSFVCRCPIHHLVLWGKQRSVNNETKSALAPLYLGWGGVTKVRRERAVCRPEITWSLSVLPVRRSNAARTKGMILDSIFAAADVWTLSSRKGSKGDTENTHTLPSSSVGFLWQSTFFFQRRFFFSFRCGRRRQ